MTFQCIRLPLVSPLGESESSLSALRNRLEELCRFFAFEGSMQQGFSHHNSSLSVFSLCVSMPQAFYCD